jgi:hypothetical protein
MNDTTRRRAIAIAAAIFVVRGLAKQKDPRAPAAEHCVS